MGRVCLGLALTVASSSCATETGSDDSAPTPPTSSEAAASTDLPAAEAATADVCSLLTSEEVAAASGGVVTEVVPVEDDISTCVWKLGPDALYSIMASVQTDPAVTFGPRSLFREANAADGAVPVAAGDEATFVPSSQAVHLRSGGKYAVVLLNGALQPEAEAILRLLAAQLAERL